MIDTPTPPIPSLTFPFLFNPIYSRIKSVMIYSTKFLNLLSGTSRKTSTYVKLLLISLGMNVQSSALELMVTTAAWFIPESTKDNLFNSAQAAFSLPITDSAELNEYTANLRTGKLYKKVETINDILEEKIKSFRILDNGSDLESCKKLLEDLSLLRAQYVLSSLRIDLAEGLKRYIEKKILELSAAQVSPKIIEYLKNRKINLGALMFAKYHYERGGFFLQRGYTSIKTKNKRCATWGVSCFPPADLATMPPEICSLINENNHASHLLKDFSKIYNFCTNIIFDDKHILGNTTKIEKCKKFYKVHFSKLTHKDPQSVHAVTNFMIECYERLENINFPISSQPRNIIPNSSKEKSSGSSVSSRSISSYKAPSLPLERYAINLSSSEELLREENALINSTEESLRETGESAEKKTGEESLEDQNAPFYQSGEISKEDSTGESIGIHHF